MHPPIRQVHQQCCVVQSWACHHTSRVARRCAALTTVLGKHPGKTVWGMHNVTHMSGSAKLRIRMLDAMHGVSVTATGRAVRLLSLGA